MLTRRGSPSSRPKLKLNPVIHTCDVSMKAGPEGGSSLFRNFYVCTPVNNIEEMCKVSRFNVKV